MADQILSQAEVNALLNAVSDGAIRAGSEEAKTREDVKQYDFSTQDRNRQGSFPALDMINERIVNLFRISLSGTTRNVVNIYLRSTEMIRYEDFINSVPLPATLSMISLRPLRGIAVVVMEGQLVYALVNILLGGSEATPSRILGKEFTRVELQIAAKVLEQFLEKMEEAWKPIFPLSPKFVRTELNPQFVAVVGGAEQVLAVPFEIQLETVSGLMTLVIPYSALDPIRRKLLASSYQAKDMLLLDEDTDLDEQKTFEQRWVQRLRTAIRELELGVTVDYGRTRLTVSDLMNLSVGDVIQLDASILDPLTARVEGIPKFQGSAGQTGQTIAFKIEKRVEPISDEGMF